MPGTDDFTTGVGTRLYYNTAFAIAAANGEPTWAEVQTAFPAANQILHVDTIPDIGITPSTIEATHYGESVAHRAAGIPTPDDFAVIIDIIETDAVHTILAELDTGDDLHLAVIKSDNADPAAATEGVAYTLSGTVTKPGHSFPIDEFGKLNLTLSPNGAYKRVIHA